MSDTELTVVEQDGDLAVGEDVLDTVEETGDFELDWIYARYENGDNVADIARELKKSEAYVYAKMRRVPEKYEDVKQIREENRNIRVRRVSSLADKTVETYLEDLQGGQR